MHSWKTAISWRLSFWVLTVLLFDPAVLTFSSPIVAVYATLLFQYYGLDVTAMAR